MDFENEIFLIEMTVGQIIFLLIKTGPLGVAIGLATSKWQKQAGILKILIFNLYQPFLRLTGNFGLYVIINA
jgi:hypothetical protein